MRPFLERLQSRKFITAIVAAMIAGLQVYYPDLPSEAIWTVVGCLMGWVAIEGAIDAAAQLAKWAAEKRTTPP
jgi:hypothetical protein